MTPASANPFRAERLDGLAFVPHDPGEDAAAVVDRFRRARWAGAVVGPRGTGKSTLLRMLADAAEADGHAVWRAFVNRQTPRLARRLAPPEGTAGAGAGAGAGLVAVWAVDGWCHLPPHRRWRLRRLAARRGAGVLGTAHSCGWGLPVLHRTRATPALLRELLQRLAPGERFDAEALLGSTRGNTREALFACYDAAAGRRDAAEAGHPAVR